MYTVLIEWDGNKPPTRFYERLHSFGIYARKRDENGNVYPNRGTEENLMVQAGAIVCQSFSSAQVIANLAKVCGALMTVVYEISETVISDVPKSVEDKFLTARKGKRKLEEQVTVTCLSCQETHHKFDIEFPVVCPVCASHRIQVVRGVVSTTIDVPGNPTPIDLANLLYANGILVFPKNVFIDDFGLSKIPDAQPPQELIEACRMALY
uniref:hypothetical protein n=1 Tax=Anaerolinea sp. TaxID=1872519 RepID=UPI002ACD62C2